MSFHVPELYRVRDGEYGSDSSFGNNGAFVMRLKSGCTVHCIASDGMGWEHVSVSRKDRIPLWEEMCRVKDLFWGAEDCVVQYHPPKSQYVNNHPYVLHLWRWTEGHFPAPDIILV